MVLEFCELVGNHFMNPHVDREDPSLEEAKGKKKKTNLSRSSTSTGPASTEKNP